MHVAKTQVIDLHRPGRQSPLLHRVPTFHAKPLRDSVLVLEVDHVAGRPCQVGNG